MFFRFLGKIFFLFYVVPFVVDVCRLVRKYAQPTLVDMLEDANKKIKNDNPDIFKNETTPRT
jgi:hypothetical protein